MVETWRLNNVEHDAYIAAVMERIQNDWSAARWDELLPWNCMPEAAAIELVA